MVLQRLKPVLHGIMANFFHLNFIVFSLPGILFRDTAEKGREFLQDVVQIVRHRYPTFSTFRKLVLPGEWSGAPPVITTRSPFST